MLNSAVRNIKNTKQTKKKNANTLVVFSTAAGNRKIKKQLKHMPSKHPDR